MKVTTKDCLDLTMPSDQVLQGFGAVRQTDTVHPPNSRGDGGVMHEERGRLVPGLSEAIIQPRDTLFTQLPIVMAHHG